MRKFSKLRFFCLSCLYSLKVSGPEIGHLPTNHPQMWVKKNSARQETRKVMNRHVQMSVLWVSSKMRQHEKLWPVCKYHISKEFNNENAREKPYKRFKNKIGMNRHINTLSMSVLWITATLDSCIAKEDNALWKRFWIKRNSYKCFFLEQMVNQNRIRNDTVLTKPYRTLSEKKF